MKKFLLMVVTAIMATVGAQAQRLKVIDSEGNAVPYASVLTPSGEYIGITNLDGELADVKGAKTVSVTHVAFKAKEVRMDGTTVGAGSVPALVTVTLEDADFGLDEISVAPKPLVYVQTYYRIYMYSAKEGMIYYRAALTDNAYDRQKKSVKANTNHVAKATIGAVKFALGMFGSLLDDHFGNIKVDKVEKRMMESGKSVGLKFVDAGPGKKTIVDNKGVIGTVTDDVKDGLRRYTYNSSLLYTHKLEAKGNEKQIKKREKREKKKQNKQETDFYLYRIDEEGNYAPEDFVMLENIDSYDVMEDGELDHRIFAVQAFNTDRAYVTKEELKQRKKDNQLKLTYENIQQFERQNNIPPLLPAVQEKLREVWKVDK